MTREELEILVDNLFVMLQDQIEDINKFDTEYGILCFKHGIRYGFEKARLRMKPDFGSFDERRYESAEQVLEELNNGKK